MGAPLRVSRSASQIAWSKGGKASFVSVEGDAVVLRSTIPSPPGSRLEATFVDAPPVVVKIKVHASKREDDGSFTIKGRFVDASRAVRARIIASCADDQAPAREGGSGASE